jgi:hypothetical protein
MVQEQNKGLVHSEFSGSAKGNFMGMELDGSKTFKFKKQTYINIVIAAAADKLILQIISEIFYSS